MALSSGTRVGRGLQGFCTGIWRDGPAGDEGGTIDILTSTNGASFTELAASHPSTTNLYEVPSLDGLVAAGYLQIGFDVGGE